MFYTGHVLCPLLLLIPLIWPASSVPCVSHFYITPLKCIKMGSLLSAVNRLRKAFDPPQVKKQPDALRFGVLGAAKAAPLAIVTPAKSHPEVIVQAVSARDRKRAEAFAKKHGIPEVKDSYQDILDDPNIDCVFIPLPNSLHYEWAVRSIRAGKHVLVEKPSVANAIEAEILFNLPELSHPNAPIILEAFHNRFYPAYNFFHSLINPADVIHVYASSMVPWWGTGKDDIYYNYSLAGGTMMQMGTYNFAALRDVFDAEPEECLSCDTKSYTEGVHDKCDYEFKAKFRFPNGGIGEAYSTLKGPTVWIPSHMTVTLKEAVVPDSSLPASQQKVQARELTLHGYVHGVFWNRVDIKDKFEIRSKDENMRVVKKWEEKKLHKIYNYKDLGGDFAQLPGEDWWMSYRHQLEQFVNQVKGRKTQTWLSRDDSFAQMKMLDMAYEKSGLGRRATSSFI
ncbi:putative oxidoreductase [Xylaria telfairii]|nr:putative oxidoreductase [Xylaria telfairii]